MVGHRVSQAELYDDRDVIIQILKLKDTVNDYAGGIIDSIDVVGDDLVINWADGTSVSLPLPSPTGISSVTGTVSGGNLTITFYMTDSSSHAFTCPLNGMATEAYVDAGLATKADAADTYTKGETDALIGNIKQPTASSLASLGLTAVDGLKYALENMTAGATIEITTITDGTNSAYVVEINARQILTPPLSGRHYFQCNGTINVGGSFYNLYQVDIVFATGVMTFYYLNGTNANNVAMTPTSVSDGFWMRYE